MDRELIRRITVQLRTQGREEAIRHLTEFAAAQEKAGKAGEAMSKAPLSATKQFEAVERAVDPAVKALHTYERRLKAIYDMAATGSVSPARIDNALARASAMSPAGQERAREQEEEARLQANVTRVLEETNRRRAQMAQERADHEIEQIHRVLMAEQAAAEQRRRNTSNYAPSTAQIDAFRQEQQRRADEAAAERQALASRSSIYAPSTSHIEEFHRQRTRVQEEAAQEELRLQANVTRRLEEEERKRLRAAIERAEAESRAEMQAIQKMLDAEREAVQYREMADPKGMADQRLKQEIANVERLVKSKAMLDDEGEKAIAALRTRHENYVRDLGGAIGQTLQQRTQLAYQANDIISGLMMGQSPLTILAQQGGQVYQAFADTPGGATAGLKAFGASVGRFMMSPLGLAAGALTLAAAAAHSFWTAGAREAVTTEQALKTHATLVTRIKDSYGDAAANIEQYGRVSREALATSMSMSAGDLRQRLRREVDAALEKARATTTVTGYSDPSGGSAFLPDQTVLRNQFKVFEEAVGRLRTEATPDLLAFEQSILRTIEAAGDNEDVKYFGRVILESIKPSLDLARALDTNVHAITRIQEAASKAAVAVASMAPAVQKLNEQLGMGRFSD